MTSVHDIGIVPAPFKAGEDLSSYQYHFVEAGGSANENTVYFADSGSATYSPLGVLQDAPSTGDAAAVVMLGPTKVVASAPGTQIKFGHWVTCDGSAHAAYTAEASLACGFALGTADSSASSIVEIFMFPNMWLTRMLTTH